MFRKYAWVIPIKDKKGTIIVNAFKKIVSGRREAESKGQRKPNKIWLDQGSEFYNNSFKDFLKINNIEMYSTYNEGKYAVAERFIRTLKNKSFKLMTAISKNVYFDVLVGIVDKYNNTVHKTIKMKSIDVTGESYVEYNENLNKKYPKFKVGDHVRISKFFVISKIKDTVPWTYVVSDLNGEEITGSFYEKELPETSQKELRIEKVLQRKSDKLYLKWKGHDNRFNSWVNKKDLISV